MENKETIFPILQGEVPILKNANFLELDEKSLMRILPTLIQKVNFVGEGDSRQIELTLYPLFPNQKD